MQKDPCQVKYKWKYRSKEEISEWIAKDPINNCLAVIKENKWLTEEGIKEIQDWVKNEIVESIEFADKSPFPEGKDLYEDVYVQKDYPFIKEY